MLSLIVYFSTLVNGYFSKSDALYTYFPILYFKIFFISYAAANLGIAAFLAFCDFFIYISDSVSFAKAVAGLYNE